MELDLVSGYNVSQPIRPLDPVHIALIIGLRALPSFTHSLTACLAIEHIIPSAPSQVAYRCVHLLYLPAKSIHSYVCVCPVPSNSMELCSEVLCCGNVLSCPEHVIPMNYNLPPSPSFTPLCLISFS